MYIYVDPAFSLDVFPLDGKTRFFYSFGEKYNFFYRKYLESPLIYVLFLKGKTK